MSISGACLVVAAAPQQLPQGAAAAPPAAEGTVLADPAWWEAIGWFDRGALLLILVFLGIGMVRGLHWQLTRTAVLLIAYLAALFLGPVAADELLAQGLTTEADPLLRAHLCGALAFIAALVLVGLLRWLLLRRREFEPPTPPARLVGAAVGGLSGALVVLALLTAVQLFHAWTGWGGGVVQAAERSTAHEVGGAVLETTEDLLPESRQRGASVWRRLFEGEQEQVTPLDEFIQGYPSRDGTEPYQAAPPSEPGTPPPSRGR
jgi:uncharacterized membrane protein required for colicin V production